MIPSDQVGSCLTCLTDTYLGRCHRRFPFHKIFFAHFGKLVFLVVVVPPHHTRHINPQVTNEALIITGYTNTEGPVGGCEKAGRLRIGTYPTATCRYLLLPRLVSINKLCFCINIIPVPVELSVSSVKQTHRSSVMILLTSTTQAPTTLPTLVRMITSSFQRYPIPLSIRDGGISTVEIYKV